MNKIIKNSIFIVFLIILNACSSNLKNKNISDKNNIADPNMLYESAISEIEKKQYTKEQKIFLKTMLKALYILVIEKREELKL